MAKKKINPKSLWLPKLQELPDQCASCPFRKDNNKEWKEIVVRLKKKFGMPEPDNFAVGMARFAVLQDVSRSGDFVCHCTVYDKDMNLKDQSEHRQCPGATAYFKSYFKEKAKK